MKRIAPFFKPILCAATLAVTITAQADIRTTEQVSTAPATVRLAIQPAPGAPRNSEGDIIRLPDDSLALVYTKFTGGSHDASSASLAIRTSQDEGVTWSADRILLENEGSANVMSVSLLAGQDDSTFLFYLRKDGHMTSCALFMRRFYDNLQTLSDPIQVTTTPGYHVVNNARVIRLKSGRILVPAALHNDNPADKSHYQPAAAMVVYRSDDDGRTWQKDAMPIPTRAQRKLVLQEPGLVELPDGSLLMYIRTAHGSQFQSRSTDQGLTWTAPVPMPLESPLSPATIKLVPDTRTLMAVWNDHSGRWLRTGEDRTPFCIAFSHDGGHTWSPSELLIGDLGGWYCYTSITFTDTKALLTHSAGRGRAGGLNQLNITELPLPWLRSHAR